MTTKHDAAKAIANIHVMRREAAKNASLGTGGAFEAHQRRKERFEAARKAEQARKARKAPAPTTSTESQPPVTSEEPTK